MCSEGSKGSDDSGCVNARRRLLDGLCGGGVGQSFRRRFVPSNPVETIARLAARA